MEPIGHNNPSEGRNKHKLCTMNETSWRKTSLLERVRQGLVATDPTTEEEKRQFYRLIIEHQSELPLKLRPEIITAASNGEIPPDFFEFRVLLPFFEDEIDSDVDTEEEVELVIRCFPCLFLLLAFENHLKD
jgi:hypothetical protein